MPETVKLNSRHYYSALTSAAERLSDNGGKNTVLNREQKNIQEAVNFRSDFMHPKGRPRRQMFSGKGSV